MEMHEITEIAELIRETRKSAEAVLKQATEQAEANALERKRLEQEMQKLVLEEHRIAQIDEALGWIRRLREDHHDPIMFVLLGLVRKVSTIMEIERAIVSKVADRKDFERLMKLVEQAMRNDTHIDLLSKNISIGDIDGDLAGNIAGEDIQQ